MSVIFISLEASAGVRGPATVRDGRGCHDDVRPGGQPAGATAVAVASPAASAAAASAHLPVRSPTVSPADPDGPNARFLLWRRRCQ